MSPIQVITMLIVSPFLAYFVVKFGAYGYFRARHIARRKEVEPTTKHNK